MPAILDLLNDNWENLDLRAESIPHLLHWDLAYLWVLERNPAQRPSSWHDRIEAWRKLVQAFLLGELEVAPLEVIDPLRGVLLNAGIRDVKMVKHGGQPVGVLSPTVLVRPLPSFKRGDLDAVPAMQPGDQPRLAHFLDLLIRQLRIAPSPPPIRATLVDILEGERNALPRSASGIAYADSAVPLALLKEIVWFRPARGSRDVTESFQVLVAAGGDRGYIFVPRCEACRELLTQDASQVIDPTERAVELVCRNCRRPNLVALENLKLWVRGSSVVVWQDRNFITHEPRTEPPHARISGNEVQFEWNPGALSGETVNRFLRLRFANRTPRAAHSDDVFYSQLLVPGGDPSAFEGWPVRPEWVDAVESIERIHAQPELVSYSGIRLRGWPFSRDKDYSPLAMRLAPELSVGIFPKRMHPDWKRYRVLLLGPGADNYEIRVPKPLSTVHRVAETHTGWPPAISVETTEQGANRTAAAGVSWKLEAPAALPVRTDNEVVFGIDFGTTNSVVYFQEANRLKEEDLKAEQNALRPAQLSRLIHWLQPAPPPAEHLGWFLPAADRQTLDPYLVPSVFWRLAAEGVFSPIRWNSAPPKAGAEPVHGFKGGGAESLERYLRELLFMAVPYALDQLGMSDRAPILQMGFAYPLAFEHGLRNEFRRALENVQLWLAGAAGLPAVHAYSINESLASLRALGEFNPGDLFLIADMGGGTLDVALFPYHRNPTARATSVMQIGSLRFGGEIVMTSHARQTAMTSRPDHVEQAYWRLREQVAEERPGLGSGFSNLLNRFQPMALEFLRTMLEAHRQHGGGNQPVKVLLVGNGWRLRELSSASLSGPEAFRKYFGEMIEAQGRPEFVFEDPHRYCAAGIPSLKHWVALGALRNAGSERARELDGPTFAAKLPAGYQIRFNGDTVEWHTLVGPGGWRNPMKTDQQLKEGRIDIDTSKGPPSDAPWSGMFEGILPTEDRYPLDNLLRDKIQQTIENHGLTKSPLALIIETHWRDKL